MTNTQGHGPSHSSEPRRSVSPPTFIKVDLSDNVVVITRDIGAGHEISPGLHAASPFCLGQKVAAEPIEPGDPVRRYGSPIGTATARIRPGELVHDHNLASNYLAATTRRGSEDA